MSKRKAVGIHVFAGGFTMGVKKVFDVHCQLESHDFGGDTCEQVAQVPFWNEPNADWPHVDAEFAYGNPRCTGFSCITAGYGEETHGAWSKQTQDIHDLCKYAVDRYPIIIWESVQQAFSVGRELLDYLRDEIFVPRHYRIAHILMNAGSFGNAQQRKRYFFVAYRNDKNFNIVPPEIDSHYAVLYDVCYKMRDRETHEAHLYSKNESYTFDSYTKLTDEEKLCVPHLPNGWSLNRLAKFKTELLPKRWQDKYKYRTSEMPFSMHCIYRTNWLRPFPTIHSSTGRCIHPEHHRPMTVGEISTIMGWPDIPRGPQPIMQIAKGIVPAGGTWLAEQAEMYLNDEWGDEDWESSYDHNDCEWKGGNSNGAIEKTFNLTRYVGKQFERDRYDLPKVQQHIIDVDHERLRATYRGSKVDKSER